MGKIHATNDFTTNTWGIDTQELAFGAVDLFISFTDGSPVTRFKKLSFGYELRQEDNIKKYGVFPPAGVTYVSSDQPYLATARLTLRPEITYTIWLWCENNGQRSEGSLTFTTPPDDSQEQTEEQE